ncbi:F-box protein [Sporobolomyces salmoneus]|uniref:F-box protein n=1 Tax=Sporobolomyces salmoneus TaxID=183962 RepID=UPI003176C28F
MSTRSTRQRGRVSYVEAYSDDSDAPESAEEVEEREDDDVDWSPTNKNKRQRTNKGKGKKGRKGKKNESDSDSSSEGEDDDEEDEEEDEDDQYNSGVNFSTKVPYEIVAEIFSYLSARELLIFDSSCKSFHSILSGPDSRALWVKARTNLDVNIPDIDIGDVTEPQLANLLFNRECESCGEGVVKTPDVHVCVRLCPACRESKPVFSLSVWVKVEDVSKLYPDFHAATAQAVSTTNYSAKNDRYQGSAAYALHNELHKVNEELEHLELLDATKQPLADEGEDDDGESEGGGGGGASGSTGRNFRIGGRSSRGKVNYAVDVDTTAETAKKVKRANYYKRSWRTYRQNVGGRLEEEVIESFSPRIREYLRTQKERHEGWKKVAEVLVKTLTAFERVLADEQKASSISTRSAIQRRRNSIERKLMKKGFNRSSFADDVWTQHPLIKSPMELTDQEWRRIKKRVTKVAGKSLAHHRWQSAVSAARQRVADAEETKVREGAARKLARLMEEGQGEDDDDDDEAQEGDEDGEDEKGGEAGEPKDWKQKLLSRPQSITKKIWKYVLPHLEDLVTSEVKLAKVDSRSSRKSRRKVEPVHRAPLSMLTFEQLQQKNDFFKAKYDKIVDMYDESLEEQSVLPLYSRFLHLPTVKELYYDIPLYATQSNVVDERVKADRIFEKKLEEILEEVAQYALDTRVHLVETVLAATGEMDEEEIANLDIIELLGDVEQGKPTPNRLINKGFFRRPTSFVFCGLCDDHFGKLSDVLRHQHDRHNLRFASLPYSPTQAQLFPIELSIHASIAVSGLYEIAEVDPEGERPINNLRKAVKGKMLVWNNQKSTRYYKSIRAEDYERLLRRIHQLSKTEEKAGGILDAPILTLRDKTDRERRREAWGNYY